MNLYLGTILATPNIFIYTYMLIKILGTSTKNYWADMLGQSVRQLTMSQQVKI